MATRFCIGCIHFYLKPAFAGYQGSDWTGRYGEENAALLCKQGYWEQEMEGKDPVPFGENMTRATNCPDYEERKHDFPQD